MRTVHLYERLRTAAGLVSLHWRFSIIVIITQWCHVTACFLQAGRLPEPGLCVIPHWFLAQCLALPGSRKVGGVKEKLGKGRANSSWVSDRESHLWMRGSHSKSESRRQGGVVIKEGGAANRKWCEVGVCGEGSPGRLQSVLMGVCSRQRCPVAGI